jgi:regulator of RNase E activity RraA
MLCHHRDQVPKITCVFSGFGQRRDVSGALLTARPPREDGPRRRLGLDAVMQAPPGSVMLVPEPGFCYKGQRDRWIEVRVRVRAIAGARSSLTTLPSSPDVPRLTFTRASVSLSTGWR